MAEPGILTVFTAQKILRELKAKISSQSKKNFVLEKDVRYLDSRIALLIQNRMALEEVRLIGPWYMLLVLTDGLSKMKLQATSRTPPRCRRERSPTTIRRNVTET